MTEDNDDHFSDEAPRARERRLTKDIRITSPYRAVQLDYEQQSYVVNQREVQLIRAGVR